jgi:arylsulfatase A-like enzyme
MEQLEVWVSRRVKRRVKDVVMEMRIGKISWAVMMVAIAGCCGIASRRAAAQDPPPYNIILLTPDQLRADSMQTYDYPLPDTPHVDEFARQGTVFTRAYSAAPWTTPSFGAILTGMFPTVHGMTLPPFQGCGLNITHPMVEGGLPPVPAFLILSPHKPILPELLRAHGVVTAADNANCWSVWDVLQRGWDQFKFFSGSQSHVEGHPDLADPFYLTAPKTLAWAQQFLSANRDRRFFIWVHFMEPHSPYNAPREYDHFRTPDDYPNLYDDNGAETRELHTLATLGDVHAIHRLEQLYASKILYVDHYVGELMRTVAELGLDKNTIIVLLSDHGELLYTHPKDFNMADHRSVYDADLHIPLIFRGPGIPAGKRSDALASHYDVLPTLLDLEGLSAPSNLDGMSLKPIFSGQASSVHPYLFGEESVLTPQYSVRDARYKLIETLRTGEIQCFDNQTDPGETEDICGQIPQKAVELKHELDLHIQAMIRKAKSYPDWENNQALAVLEQRDSKALETLAPRELSIAPPGGAHFQLTGRAWRMVQGATDCRELDYWAPPGPGTASAIWRSDTPLIGDYEVSLWYTGGSDPGQKLATDANFTVHFKGGTLSFPMDQSQGQGRWNVLGRFHDPVGVELTNRASGPVVAGKVRFVRVE